MNDVLEMCSDFLFFSVSFLLLPERWASLGECFIALYDHLTSQDNPQVKACFVERLLSDLCLGNLH